jgi:hypothetical protein
MLLDVAVVGILTGVDEIKIGAILPAQFEARAIALIRARHATLVTLLGDGVAEGGSQTGVDRAPIELARRAALKLCQVVRVAAIIARGASGRRTLLAPSGGVAGANGERLLAELGARA